MRGSRHYSWVRTAECTAHKIYRTAVALDFDLATETIAVVKAQTVIDTITTGATYVGRTNQLITRCIYF